MFQLIVSLALLLSARLPPHPPCRSSLPLVPSSPPEPLRVTVDCRPIRGFFCLADRVCALSGAFMDSPYNGNASLQTSTSNLNASFSRPPEPEDDGKVSSETIWLWVAVIATIGNIVVVAVVCACAF